jgi:hypothetical protein
VLVNFGDGATASATVGSGANFLPFHHTYADDGAYAASVIATGSVEGHGGSTDFNVNVADVPPDLRLGGNNYALRNVNYDVTLFHYDPGDDPLTSWHINWGDNTASDVAGSADHATHKYTTYGTYTVTASAFEDGAEWPVYAQGDFPVTVTNGAPDAPTALRTTALSRSKIQLAWKAPDAAETAGFKISYSADGANFSPFATINNPNARAFTATNLDHLHPYTFSVSAYNANGDSDYSDTASETTTDDEWEDQGAVTVDASGDMSYVNDDEEFPAADDYRLLYDSGATQIDDPNYQNPAQFIAMNFIYGTGPDHLITGQPYPGNQDGYYFQTSQEDAQYEATPTLWPLQHPGGKIGLQFDHDWLSDYTSGSTTWNLQRRIPHVGVWIIGGQDTTWEDPHPAAIQPIQLAFNRDGWLEKDMTINFNTQGDTSQVEGTLSYWGAIDPETGERPWITASYNFASGSLTIPAGVDTVFVDLYAVDDSTPEWTKVITLDIEDSEDYVVDHFADNDGSDSDGDGYDEDPDATMFVGDDDITIGLGASDMIGSFDGTKHLVPLTLNPPQDAKEGATVTLTVPYGVFGKVKIWDTPNPDPDEDEPLIDTTGDNWYTWDAGHAPQTVYVGATDGSNDYNDMFFKLSDSDAASPRPKGNCTSNEDDSNKATSRMLQLLFGGQAVGDDAGKVVVGQYIPLQAMYKGPGERPTDHYNWTIDAEAYEDYTISADRGQLKPAPTGDQKDSVQFIWTSSGNKNVDVKRTIDGVALEASSKFDVLKPTATITDTKTGSVIVGNEQADNSGNWLLQAGQKGVREGIELSAKVDKPQGWTGNGSWAFLQVFKTYVYVYVYQNNQWTQICHSSMNGKLLLDDQFPEVNVWDYGTTTASTTPMPVGDGRVYIFHDTPSLTLSGQWTYKARNGQNVNFFPGGVTIDDNFDLYIMFKPSNGTWVPLKDIKWHVSMEAWKNAQNGWNKGAFSDPTVLSTPDVTTPTEFWGKYPADYDIWEE